MWTFSAACPSRCTYCDIHRQAASNCLTRDEKIGLASQIADEGFEEVILGGGEPLLSPDLPDVLSLLEGRAKTAVFSGGLPGMADRAAEVLRQGEVGRVVYSIDSGDEGTNDAIRGRGGVTNALFELARAVRSRAPDVDRSVNTIVSRFNVDSLSSVWDRMEEYGLRSWSLTLVGDTFDASPRHAFLDQEQADKFYLRTVPSLARRVESAGAELIVLPVPYEFRAAGVPPAEWGDVSSELRSALEREFRDYADGRYNAAFVSRHGCPLVGSDVVIRLEGDIYPCSQAPIIQPRFAVGNVRRERLSDILRGEALGSFAAGVPHSPCFRCWAPSNVPREELSRLFPKSRPHRPRSRGGLDARLASVRSLVASSAEPLHVPLGLVFRPADGNEHLRRWNEYVAKRDRPAALYVHVPFCARVCTYCLLSPRKMQGRAAGRAYVDALKAHIELLSPVAGRLALRSVHIGGGTPTILAEDELDELCASLKNLALPDPSQVGIEVHPATATRARLALVRRHGIGRVSMGVESMTPEVLRRVNREDQTGERVRLAVAAARDLGLAVNIDLLAGLPGETEETWAETVRRTLSLEPDSLSVNRFVRENSLLADSGSEPDGRAGEMLLVADRIVRSEGAPRWPEEPLLRPEFGTQYVWDRSSGARRFFQEDMIGPVSTLAAGYGALGHLHGRFFSVTAGELDEYQEALSAGKMPRMLEAEIDERFEMAFYVSERAYRGDLTTAAFLRTFERPLSSAFGEEIDFLLARGLLRVTRGRIAKPTRLDFQAIHLIAFLLARDEGESVALATDREHAPISDYERAGCELPPTMLWSRLAIRAAQAGRGRQRMATDV